MEPVSRKINVFISYSHRDRKYLKELLVHLKSLEQYGQISIWSDEKIVPGTDWQKAIKQAIEKASVAILLISPDFVASEFIRENELPPLLQEREDKKKLEVIPVILRRYYTKNANLARFQALNDPKKPIAGLPPTMRDEWWVKVAKAVDDAVKRQKSSSSANEDAQPEQNQPPLLHTPDLVLPPEEKKRQAPGITQENIPLPTKTMETDQQRHRTTRAKRFCPYCHEELDFSLCAIVATQPLYDRGTPLATSAQRFSLDQADLESLFELHRDRQPRYQCNRCQYILPPDIATTPLKKFVIAGNTESGLPSYIAALIYQMSKQSILSGTKRLLLYCVTPLAQERYNQKISGAHFPSLSELIHTSNQEAEDLACPLIYELPARTILHRRLPKTYLAIYEVTGRTFTNNFRIQQHVEQADACIYLHNPEESSASPSESILHTLFPDLSAASPSTGLPVAITFTKADRLTSAASYFQSSSTSSISSVDLTDLRAIENTLLNTLASNASAQTLITTAQKGIDPNYVHFFAVSSLHNTSLSPEPFRCLDPLLWLLYKLGLITARPDSSNNGSAI